MKRFVLSVLVIFAVSMMSVLANENVRAVQGKLKAGGFYFGEIDGAFSHDLAAAVTRYQIRNGLQITGQIDAETAAALGAKPEVAGTEVARDSEAWRKLCKSDQQFLTKINAGQNRATATPPNRVAAAPSAARPEQASAQRAAPDSSTDVLVPASGGNGSTFALSPERLRDYIGAFVLAGIDPQIGAELEFFSERVRYYDDGVVSREKIGRDLEQYAARWPERRFWLAGEIKVEPQPDSLVRVTFPLRFELRNGSRHSSGKVEKTLLLEVTGDDLQIVAVNESKAL
jgi:hypothetical protein